MSDLFQEFKNKTGLRTQDIERETGYTRQGLIYAFKKLETEGVCSKPFKSALDNLTRRLIFEQSERHMSRCKELQSVHEMLNR